MGGCHGGYHGGLPRGPEYPQYPPLGDLLRPETSQLSVAHSYRSTPHSGLSPVSLALYGRPAVAVVTVALALHQGRGLPVDPL